MLHSPRWRVTKEYWLLRQYADLPDETRFLVDHMRSFVDDYRNATPDVYWHRKSGQVVLAVLLLKVKNKLHCVRGINSELSLPSGSVCAERAAITSALSQFLSIARTDFVSIAVLAPNNANPIKPCGVCCEWIKKIEEASPTFSIITFNNNTMDELLEYSSVTVSEQVIEEVPEHLRGNWMCKCGFQLNRSQQVYCSGCKQFRFRFKSHLQQTRITVLKAIKHDCYPFAETPRSSHTPRVTLASPVPPQTSPSVSDEDNKSRRRSSVNVFIDATRTLIAITALPHDVVVKTLKDLLSLKFIQREDERFIITSLGSDFLEASSRLT